MPPLQTLPKPLLTAQSRVWPLSLRVYLLAVGLVLFRVTQMALSRGSL
ncbi:MAG: hypothetical protein ABI282_04125 [Candidatus Baltobacteraceae bacterium]